MCPWPKLIEYCAMKMYWGVEVKRRESVLFGGTILEFVWRA
jgi:hypothetical protein